MFKVIRVTKEDKDIKVKQDQVVLLVSKVIKDFKDIKDTKDIKVRQVEQVVLVFKDIKDFKVDREIVVLMLLYQLHHQLVQLLEIFGGIVMMVI